MTPMTNRPFSSPLLPPTAPLISSSQTTTANVEQGSDDVLWFTDNLYILSASVEQWWLFKVGTGTWMKYFTQNVDFSSTLLFHPYTLSQNPTNTNNKYQSLQNGRPFMGMCDKLMSSCWQRRKKIPKASIQGKLKPWILTLMEHYYIY